MATRKTLMGRTEPRIVTPPARKLTAKTSDGPAAVAWLNANLSRPLLPHQAAILRRGLELNRDGTYRHRVVLVIGGRQGALKTSTASALATWRMATQQDALVLTTSAQAETAREFMLATARELESSPTTADRVASVRRANGSQAIELTNGSRLLAKAATDRSTRGYSADLVIVDELMTHTDWTPWSAIQPTIAARPNPQIWAFSSAAVDTSIVLKSLRASAIDGSDPTICLIEFSAPADAEIDDEEGAWTYSLPALGRVVNIDVIRAAKATMPPSRFKVEYLAIEQAGMDGVVGPEAWAACLDEGNLDAYRGRVMLGVDLSPDTLHCSVVAAAVMNDGRVRIEDVAAWTDTGTVLAQLPGLVEKIKPRSIAYAPAGPIGCLAPDLAKLPGAKAISGADVARACSGLAEAVAAGRIAHSGSPLLTAHVLGSQRKPAGDSFVFSRLGGHCDSAYAAALALFVARSQPSAVPTLRLLTARAA